MLFGVFSPPFFLHHTFALMGFGAFLLFAYFFGVMVYSLKILIHHQKFNSFLVLKLHFSAKKWLLILSGNLSLDIPPIL